MQPFYTYPNQYANYQQPYQTAYAPRQPQPQANYQPQPQQAFVGTVNAPNGNPQPIVAYVNGIEGAKGYVLYPNQIAVLFDSDDSEKFYVKNADANGVPTLERYIKIKDDAASTTTDTKVDYVTKKDFDKLKKMVEKIGASIPKEESDK